MRIVFLLALLGGAVFYTYIAFTDLGFLTRTGRLGPGFFPRIVGLGIIVMTLWAIFDALGQRRTAAAADHVTDGLEDARWRDFVLLVALVIGYAVLIRLFGGWISTILYLGVALSLLNPGQLKQNLLVATLFPSGVYLLFDRVLNANMPPALINLPF